MAESNMLADRDEDFNTRYGSFRGWQLAIQRVKPISRHAARLDLSSMIREQNLKSTDAVIDYFIARFLRVPVAAESRAMLVNFLEQQLGTDDIAVAESYMEDALRMTLHLLMSQPEYQLG